MALDINGYNDTFRAFTDFAQTKVGERKEAAVAHIVGGGGPLSGRSVTATNTDSAYAFTRSSKDKVANNDVRAVFRRAIIDMFGGESKIPKKVRDAMILSDYGSGKPLTARRIMAVKAAIDADGTAKVRSENMRRDEELNSFADEGLEEVALAKGYLKNELPKLARAAHFYAFAAGLNEAKAFEEVARPGSDANRLMGYGGKFMESRENFEKGLQLIGKFKNYFAQMAQRLGKVCGLTYTFTGKESIMQMNGNATVFSNIQNLKGLEKFVFEDIAFNPKLDIGKMPASALFGIETNNAMRFFARNLDRGITQTIMQIPPEKRTAFFVAMNLMTPLMTTAQEANVAPSRRRTPKPGSDIALITARILKNFDKIQSLVADGKLTLKELARTCFPELPKKSKCDLVAVVSQLKSNEAAIFGDYVNNAPARYPEAFSYPIHATMLATGCSIDEAAASVQGQAARPKELPYFSGVTMALDAFDGTANAAREQLEADMIRPTNYGRNTSPRQGLIPPEVELGFHFAFPDGEKAMTNNTEAGRAAAANVCNKIEELCGKVHPKQASSVMVLCTQSGTSGVTREALRAFGISASEHAALDFTFTKNAETGDITIRYSSPRELPFSFEWTATVKPDGQTTTTPLRFIDEAKMVAVGSAVDAAKSAFVAAKPTVVNNVGEARLAENIEIAMKAVAGDADAMGVLCDESVIDEVLFNSNNQLRSPDEIARKALLVKANVEELRQATQGDKAMFDAGIKALPFFAGKTLPPGIIADLVRAVKAAKLDSVTGLNANSGVVDIHNAVHQIVRATVQMTATAHILDSLHDLGEDGSAAVKNLISSFLFARIPANRLPTIRDALSSVNATRLRSVYGYIGDYENKGAINDALKNKTKYMNVVRSAIVSLDLLERLRQNIAESLGEAFKLLGNFNGDMFEDDGVKRGFTPAIRDIEKLVTDFNVKI